MDGGRLTDERFWDEFWSPTRLPARVDTRQPSDRALARMLAEWLPLAPGPRLVELGCAPGKWMAHCARAHGMTVTGYESSPHGAELTRANLAHLEVDGTVVETDLLNAVLPEGTFDAVISLGLVEHFDDPSEMMVVHARLAAPHGLVIVEVPNLRRLNLWLLQWTRSPLLAHHNLDVMSTHSLDALAVSTGLVPVGGGYIGGFEPSLFDVHSKGLAFRGLFSLLARARSSIPALDRVNSQHFSGALYRVYRRASTF